MAMIHFNDFDFNKMEPNICVNQFIENCGIDNGNKMIFLFSQFLEYKFNIKDVTFIELYNITKKKFKVCLEYHIGNCKGPCEGLQTLSEYNEGINQLKLLLNGNLKPLISELKEKVKIASNNLEYEKAALYQNKITLLY